MSMLKKLFFSLILVSVFFLPNLSKALTVGPAKLEFSVNPGDSVNFNVLVKNEGKEIYEFFPSFEKFEEKNGEKVFIKNQEGISSWIKTVASIKLGAGEQREVPVTISVPKDASPGGHFAVIWWNTAPPGGKDNVSIITRAGILVYARISGEIIEKGSLMSFGPESFFTRTPVNFLVNFKNEGNVHLKPQGTLKIKNIFNGVVGNLNFNEFGLQILPKNEKFLSAVWESKGFHFGFYRAQIDLAFGENQQKQSSSAWFFIYSLNSIIVICLMAFIIFVAPWAVRKYNRWIIGRYQK